MNPKGSKELSIPGKVIRLTKKYYYGFGWNTVLKNKNNKPQLKQFQI